MVHVTPALALLAALAAGTHAAHADGVGSEASARPDTTFVVREGDHLVLQNLSGRVSVRSWDRDEVRIEVDAQDGPGVRLRRSGAEVRVRADQRHDHGRGRYVVSTPSWMKLEIRGSELDVTVQGVDGGVEIRTGEGDVEVRDANGPVTARSVEGVVTVVDVVGPVVAISGDDDVYVRRVRGSVVAQTVDGDVTVEDVEARAVDASTVDGDVRFSGALEAGGEYRLVTHDGDIVATLDESVSASVVVSTYDGDFASEFVITLEGFSSGKELRFTLGTGQARLTLEAFDGNIRLRRR